MVRIGTLESQDLYLYYVLGPNRWFLEQGQVKYTLVDMQE